MATRIPKLGWHWRAGFVWSLSLASALVSGCDDDIVETCPGFCPPPYSIPSAPESLIANLQVSYRRREIDEYAKILAPEFKFQFQPIDANTIGNDFWTRDQDSTGTCALLTTTLVAAIRINLTYQKRDTLDVSAPIDSVKIRIVTTDLQVDQTDGITWVASNQQDLFFRKGLETKGENPNYWWMYAWNDLPSLSSTGPPRATEPTAVALTTWGKLKSRYR